MIKVSLIVNGKEYSYWKKVSIKRSIETLAGSFNLEVTDKRNLIQAVDIKEGDKCEILIEDKKVMTGYIDEVEKSISSGEHSVKVNGRDKTCDLVDCAAIHSTGNWKNVPFEKVVTELASTYGISVLIDEDLQDIKIDPKNDKTNAKARKAQYSEKNNAKIAARQKAKILKERFNLQPGETAFDAISRLVKYAGSLLIANPEGNILIASPGNTNLSFAIIENPNDRKAGNAKSITWKKSSKDLHQIYEVMSQNRIIAKSSYTNSEIKRFRKTILIVEGTADKSKVQKRAQFEDMIRRAKSESISAKIWGWYNADNILYDINKMIDVKSESLGINSPYLITDIDYTQSPDDGTVCDLVLKPKNVYLLESEV